MGKSEIERSPDMDVDVQRLFLRQSVSRYGQGWISSSNLQIANGPTLYKMEFDFACWHPESKRPEVTGLDPTTHTQVVEEVFETADFRQIFYLQLPQGEPRGLVIHAFSMDGRSTSEGRVLDALRQRGWAVLRTRQMTVYPWGRADADGGWLAEVGDPSQGYAHVADSMAQALASYAYAGEAAVEYTREQWSSLRDKPIIVAGFSMGAIMAPTLAARLGDDVAAVVLVGGGADLPAIAMDSPMTRHWEPLRDVRTRLSHAQFRKARDAYRARTELDPYATAPLLRGRPVLVVQASDDWIVPQRYGDLLWERLGRPERWIVRGGHILLFWRLGRYAEDIAAWADGAAAEFWGWEGRGAGEED